MAETSEKQEFDQFVEKVKTLASMMQTPFEHEVTNAVLLLRRLLDEHSMAMLDLQLKNLAPDHGKTRADIVNEDISEVIFKHSTYELEGWLKTMIDEVTRIYGVKTVQDMYSSYLKLIGFPSHPAVVKFVIFYLRKYIETNIKKNGYTKESYIDEYVLELMHRIVQDIEEDVDLRATPQSKALYESKLLRLSAYINKHYTNRLRTSE